MQSAKHKLSEEEFCASLAQLEWPDALVSTFLPFFTTHAPDIRSAAVSLEMKFASYRDCEWRLDVQLGSRMAAQQVEPKVLMRLELDTPAEKGERTQMHTVEIDAANLRRMSESLDAALAEADNVHVQRMQRYIR